MNATVIAMSRALGAGGEEVGRNVAARLGFRFVDDEIVARAAAKAGVDSQAIEKVERSPSLIERILKHMGTAAVDPGFGASAAPVLNVSDSYENLIAEVIHEIAHAGNVVILAHGASIPLAGMPGLLRVLITGSPQARAARVAAAAGIEAPRAAKQVEDSDRQELPTHYDLVVNTDQITLEKATDLIARAAGMA